MRDTDQACQHVQDEDNIGHRRQDGSHRRAKDCKRAARGDHSRMLRGTAGPARRQGTAQVQDKHGPGKDRPSQLHAQPA